MNTQKDTFYWKNYSASHVYKIFEEYKCGYIFLYQGLPGIQGNSCDSIYCSHLLENVAYNQFHKALKNSFKLLQPKETGACGIKT